MQYGIRRSRLVTALERVPVAGRWIRRLYDRWLARKFELAWKYFANPPSRRRFASQRCELDRAQQAIVGNLKNRGVTITSFDTVLTDRSRWDGLRRSVDEFSSSEPVREGIALYNRELALLAAQPEGSPISAERARILNKYWITLYAGDETPTIALDDPWMRFALHPRVLDVVNSYFGMWSKLIYFDLWHTVPVEAQSRRFGSQKWHRDPEDRTKVRLYLYFVDIQAASGPLQYIPGSQLGGPRWDLHAWPGPLGSLPARDEEVERRSPSSDWVTCCGPPGTLVLCDTIGLHRGGIATAGARILATWAFVTPASLHGRRFRVNWRSGSGSDDLSPAARYAIS
jgi:hypothetical protein